MSPRKKRTQAAKTKTLSRQTKIEMVKALHARGYSNAQIAETTGLNENDVRVQILQTRERS